MPLPFYPRPTPQGLAGQIAGRFARRPGRTPLPRLEEPDPENPCPTRASGESATAAAGGDRGCAAIPSGARAPPRHCAEWRRAARRATRAARARPHGDLERRERAPAAAPQSGGAMDPERRGDSARARDRAGRRRRRSRTAARRSRAVLGDAEHGEDARDRRGVTREARISPRGRDEAIRIQRL
jgi:hypothetical protein